MVCAREGTQKETRKTHEPNCDGVTLTLSARTAAPRSLTMVFLVRSGDHAREHREQRRPRGGGDRGGRPASARRRPAGRGHGSRGGVSRGRSRAVRRGSLHLARPRLLLPLVPSVFGPVQIPVLVEDQTDAGRVQPVRFPECSGRVQLLFGHLEQYRTVAECYGHAAHLRVL